MSDSVMEDAVDIHGWSFSKGNPPFRIIYFKKMLVKYVCLPSKELTYPARENHLQNCLDGGVC